MEIEGIVKSVGQTQSISPKFAKREIVITTNDQYPQVIMAEFHQDKVKLLDNIQPNQNVKIAINVRGREWANPQGQVKYFTTIQGWKIDVVGAQQPVQQQYQQPPAAPYQQQPQQPAQQQYQQPGPPPPQGQPVGDDLPF